MSFEIPSFFPDHALGPIATRSTEGQARALSVLMAFDALFLEALGFEAPAAPSAAYPVFLGGLDCARIPSAPVTSTPAGVAVAPGDPRPAATAPVGDAPATGRTGNPFLDSLWEAAKGTGEALGIPPNLLLAHAALESGWGKRSIRGADGQDSHNLFGIKAGRSWTGRTVAVRTTEYVGGLPRATVDTFRAYDSYAEAFADYAHLLKARFSGALEQTTGEGFGRALQAGGYATDPHYASKLAAVARSVTARLETA
jgi:flagellar protein FlgJ